MQPFSSSPGANGTAQIQGNTGGPQPPAQQSALNITGVHNAPGVNPEMLGIWTMETSDQVQSQTNITLRLQQATPPLQVTPENADAINFTAQTYQPNLRQLPLGAEALTADFTVTPMCNPEGTVTFPLNAFAKDDRIAMGPMSSAERKKLHDKCTIPINEHVLDAITALTDTDVNITTMPLEQTLEAEHDGKKVIFRRPIAAVLQQDPRLFSPEVERAAAVSPHNNAIKQRLLETIQNSQYCFDPADASNTTKIKQNWTLCYYQGTTPVPANTPTKVNIEHQLPGNTTSSLYADFWQNGFDGEDGQLTLTENRLTLTPDGEMSKSARPLQALPGDIPSQPEDA